MRENKNIKQIINAFTCFCNIIYKMKLNKHPIKRRDHEMFLSCLFGLIKLKIIDNDESNGYLIMPNMIGKKKFI
jgi:hypothetical protein